MEAECRAEKEMFLHRSRSRHLFLPRRVRRRWWGLVTTMMLMLSKIATRWPTISKLPPLPELWLCLCLIYSECIDPNSYEYVRQIIIFFKTKYSKLLHNIHLIYIPFISFLAFFLRRIPAGSSWLDWYIQANMSLPWTSTGGKCLHCTSQFSL